MAVASLQISSLLLTPPAAGFLAAEGDSTKPGRAGRMVVE
jgi:hypothetical protein